MRAEKISLDALTGLRFIAALFVAHQHCSGHLGVDEFRTPSGNLAVAFFFMLSGFILTYAYQGRLQKATEFPRFWFARFARIWPLHLMTAVICVFGLTVRAFPESDPQRFSKLFANLFLVHAWVPNYNWLFSINAVSWSISVEAFFYLMFPFCFWGGYEAFKKKYVAILATTAVVIGGIAYCEVNGHLPHWCHPDAILHSNPLLRLLEFATGMLLGFKFNALPNESKKFSFNSSVVLEAVSIALVIAFAYAISYRLHTVATQQLGIGGHTINSWLHISFPALAFVFLIWSFARSTGPLAYFLSRPAMVFLGEISFSFYMIHQFIILKMEWHFPNGVMVISPSTTFAVVVAISIVASALLYRLVEIPAKTLLLCFYDRKWKSAGEFVMQFAKTELRSPVVAALLLALLGFSTFVMELGQYSPIAPPHLVADLLKNHAVGDDGIEFDCGATLHAASITKTRHGDLRVTTLWTQTGETPMRRFIHLCDEKGQRVGFARQRPTCRTICPSDNYSVDTVTITSREIGTATGIGVGFHAPNIGMANVEEGKISLNGHRLHIPFPGSLDARLEDAKRQWLAAIKEEGSQPNAIKFKDCADLLNVQLKPLKEGLLVQSQWRCNKDLAHQRFLHICDSSGKIIRQAKQSQENLKFKAKDHAWVDQVLIPYDDLNDAYFCGIGFYSPETGSVKVSDGPRDMHDCRLQLKLPWDEIRVARVGPSTTIR